MVARRLGTRQVNFAQDKHTSSLLDRDMLNCVPAAVVLHASERRNEVSYFTIIGVKHRPPTSHSITTTTVLERYTTSKLSC